MNQTALKTVAPSLNFLKSQQSKTSGYCGKLSVSGVRLACLNADCHGCVTLGRSLRLSGCAGRQIFVCLFLWIYHVAGGILVLWSVIELTASAVKVRSPSHWASKEVPGCHLCATLHPFGPRYPCSPSFFFFFFASPLDESC